MDRFIIGSAFGVLICAIVAFVAIDQIEIRSDTIMLVGLFVIFFTSVLIWTVYKFHAQIIKSVFGRSVGNLDLVIENFVSSIASLAANNIDATVQKARLAGLEFAAWHATIAFRNFTVRTTLGLLIALGGFLGALLLVRQNVLLKKQNSLIESQSEFLKVQTLAARIEQFYNLTKQIDDLKPHLSRTNASLKRVRSGQTQEVTVLERTISEDYDQFELDNKDYAISKMTAGMPTLEVIDFVLDTCAPRNAYQKSISDFRSKCEISSIFDQINLPHSVNNTIFSPNIGLFLGWIVKSTKQIQFELEDFILFKSSNVEANMDLLSAAMRQCRSDLSLKTLESRINSIKKIDHEIQNVAQQWMIPNNNKNNDASIRRLIIGILELDHSSWDNIQNFVLKTNEINWALTVKEAENIHNAALKGIHSDLLSLYTSCNRTFDRFETVSTQLDPITGITDEELERAEQTSKRLK